MERWDTFLQPTSSSSPLPNKEAPPRLALCLAAQAQLDRTAPWLVLGPHQLTRPALPPPRSPLAVRVRRRPRQSLGPASRAAVLASAVRPAVRRPRLPAAGLPCLPLPRPPRRLAQCRDTPHRLPSPPPGRQLVAVVVRRARHRPLPGRPSPPRRRPVGPRSPPHRPPWHSNPPIEAERPLLGRQRRRRRT